MNFQIKPLSPVMGAEVIGVDLAKPLSDADFEQIRQAWLQHLLLVFRDQELTPEQHMAFSERLGPLQIHFAKKFLLPEHPEIYVLSNIVKEGQPMAKGSTPYWHTDLSYLAKPAAASMLYGREVPDTGGDTLYSNMYLAFAGLPAKIREQVLTLKAVHNMSEFPARYERKYGQPLTPGQSEIYALAAHLPDVTHPLVIKHPDTGKPALYLNEGFTTRILGVSEQESDDLLGSLNEHYKKESFVYRHKWRRHDANLWDNRCTNHSATGGYKAPLYRLMHRTTIGAVELLPAV